MALEHVAQTLAKIDWKNGNATLVPFVEFLRYVYANTDHLDHHNEPLRSLVSCSIAHNFKTLQSTPEIAQLLSEGGDIVMDVRVAVSRGPSPSQPPATEVPRYPPRYIQYLEVFLPFSIALHQYTGLTPLRSLYPRAC